MTFDDIVNFVCAKIGQTDANSVALCGQFLTSRGQMIWDAQPWRDSLSVVSVPLPNIATGWPSVVNPWVSCPWILLPPEIARVMKVRFDPLTCLSPWEASAAFDIAPDSFEQTGSPIAFIQYPPVVAQISGDSTNVHVNLGVIDLFAAPNDVNNPAIVFNFVIEAADGTLLQTSSQVFQKFNLVGSGVFIRSVQKPVTQGQYYLSPATGQIAIPFPSPTVGSNDLYFPQVQRIRFVRAPSGIGSILVLGKRVFPGFSSGQQYPLASLDNALQDFVHSDMLERDRQYAKAQAKIQSANSQMTVAYDLETKTSANERRIIPVDVGQLSPGAGVGFPDKLWV